MNLHECVAIEKDAKARAEKARTALYHTLQKPDLFAGHARQWVPAKEEYTLADTNSAKGVQAVATELLPTVREIMSNLYDVSCARDRANREARADVVVEDDVVLTDVPVPFLLYLEKELTHLHTMIQATPTPDPAHRWDYDASSGLLRTQPSKTIKTQKVPRSLEVAAPTDRHPGQYQVYNVDEPVGYFEQTHLSGALRADDKKRMLERVVRLREAVKSARCRANETTVKVEPIGKPLFDWLFKGTALEQSSS